MWRNLAQLFRYRGLIQSLVARELKARYRGSVLGFFWSFVNPLLLLIIYSFVFSTIMPRDPLDPTTNAYPVFMFAGLLPWTWFAASLMEGAGSLISGGNLIKKVLFPAEVLPIVTVISNLVHFLLGLLILAAFMVWNRHYPDPLQLIWLPVVMLLQFIFTAGLALLLSALTVHFRDIRDLLSNLLTFWFFATPIIYYYQLPSVVHYKWLFRWNPFYHFVVSYQELLYFWGPFGHLKWLPAVAGMSFATFFLGYWVFDRLRDSFAESV